MELTPWLYTLGLLALGLALIAADILATPGLDLLGLMGVLALLAAVAYAYSTLGLAAAVAVTAVVLLSSLGLIRLLLRSRAWRQLIHPSQASRDQGFDSSVPGQAPLLGERGETLSPLRPSGRALLGLRRLDVVTEGDFIGPGEPVEVVAVAGNRVVVRRPTEPAPADPAPPQAG